MDTRYAYLIIDTQTGTVLDLTDCYLVNANDCDDQDDADLDMGSDVMTAHVAKRRGRNLADLLESCGYGDLNYTNCFSLSPTALREEANECIEMYSPSAVSETLDAYKWVANTATDEELHNLASEILMDEKVWNTISVSLIESLLNK